MKPNIKSANTQIRFSPSFADSQARPARHRNCPVGLYLRHCPSEAGFLCLEVFVFAAV